ncbi:MAG: UbiA family prenyltransferase [Bacteriovoracales bacterium]
MLKDLRYLRVCHYLIWGILGATLRPHNLEFKIPLFQDFVFTIFAIILGILFSIITNNIFDAEIDQISNPNRPLIKKEIGLKEYKLYGFLSLFFSMVFSLMVNLEIFLLNGLFIFAYFIYSAPPFRLKRVPIFSKWVIGFNSLVLLNMGRILIYPNNLLPLIPSLLIIVGVGLIANFIDLKDIEGDRIGKINTLPVLLGETWAKNLVGTFFLIIYPASLVLLIPYFHSSFLMTYFLPIMIFVGLCQFFLVKREDYNEVPIFWLNNLTVLSVALCLLKSF